MKIVVAYSGGLDTSVLLTWLKETYSAEIIAFCADVGQEEELDGLEDKALRTGASKCFIDDLREEFARDFIFPMIQAGAIYEGQYFLGTSIARPLIAKRMVEIARAERRGRRGARRDGQGQRSGALRTDRRGARAGTGSHRAVAAGAFSRAISRSRGDDRLLRKRTSIPVQASAKKPYSMDRNLLHISFEAGILEDPWFDASAEKARDMYVLSVSPEEAPDKAEHVELVFEKGNCVAIGYHELDALLRELGHAAMASNSTPKTTRCSRRSG